MRNRQKCFKLPAPTQSEKQQHKNPVSKSYSGDDVDAADTKTKHTAKLTVHPRTTVVSQERESGERQGNQHNKHNNNTPRRQVYDSLVVHAGDTPIADPAVVRPRRLEGLALSTHGVRIPQQSLSFAGNGLDWHRSGVRKGGFGVRGQ